MVSLVQLVDWYRDVTLNHKRNPMYVKIDYTLASPFPSVECIPNEGVVMKQNIVYTPPEYIFNDPVANEFESINLWWLGINAIILHNMDDIDAPGWISVTDNIEIDNVTNIHMNVSRIRKYYTRTNQIKTLYSQIILNTVCCKPCDRKIPSEGNPEYNIDMYKDYRREKLSMICDVGQVLQQTEPLLSYQQIRDDLYRLFQKNRMSDESIYKTYMVPNIYRNRSVFNSMVIEQNTQQQVTCLLWWKVKYFMISGSITSDFVLRISCNKVLQNKIKDIMDVNRFAKITSFSPEAQSLAKLEGMPPMISGQIHENMVKDFLRNGLGFNIQDCGFIRFAKGSIFDDYLMFGASPDGVSPELSTVYEIKTVPSLLLNSKDKDCLWQKQLWFKIDKSKAPLTAAKKYKFLLIPKKDNNNFNLDKFCDHFNWKFSKFILNFCTHDIITDYFKFNRQYNASKIFKIYYETIDGEKVDDGFSDLTCSFSEINESEREHWVLIPNPLHPYTLQIMLECASLASVTYSKVENINAIYAIALFTKVACKMPSINRKVLCDDENYIYTLNINNHLLRCSIIVNTRFPENFIRSVLFKARSVFFKALQLSTEIQ